MNEYRSSEYRSFVGIAMSHIQPKTLQENLDIVFFLNGLFEQLGYFILLSDYFLIRLN